MGAILVGAGERFALEVTLAALDTNGVQQERTKSYAFSDIVTTYVAAITATGDLLTDIAAIEEADIIAYAVRTIFDESTGAVTSVGSVYKEATLTLRKAGSTKKLSHVILSPYDAMISGNSVVSTALLQAYLDNFEAGAAFTISDGEQISTDEATRIAASRVRQVAAKLK